jgi:hypothetical protein
MHASHCASDPPIADSMPPTLTLVIIIGGGHNEVSTSSYHTIRNFDLAFVAFIVVFLLLCAALILGDGTVVTTFHVLTINCPCLFPPCPPLFPLIRLFVMLGSNLMVMGRWIGVCYLLLLMKCDDIAISVSICSYAFHLCLK